MSRSQIDGVGLLIAVAAAVLILRLCSQGPFDWIGSIGGLALVLILLGFDRDTYRTPVESLGFSAVFGFAAMVATTAVLRMLGGTGDQPAPLDGRITGQWMPMIWGLVTIIFWPIDRARMSGRVASVPASSASFRFSPTPTAPPLTTELPPSPVPEVPVAQSIPVPNVSRAAFTQPTFSQPVPPPPPAPAPVVATPAPPPPVPVSSPAPSPNLAPPPQSAPIPAGKEATIYVTLVGEGLNVLRAVRAEHLGRDYYKIVEEMPEGETWQFGPGQVVRCKKKNLSSGKAMVAYEEAQRAQ
jgi:hypothetical protein